MVLTHDVTFPAARTTRVELAFSNGMGTSIESVFEGIVACSSLKIFGLGLEQEHEDARDGDTLQVTKQDFTEPRLRIRIDNEHWFDPKPERTSIC